MKGYAFAKIVLLIFYYYYHYMYKYNCCEDGLLVHQFTHTRGRIKIPKIKTYLLNSFFVCVENSVLVSIVNVKEVNPLDLDDSSQQ
jgi:hypothetical protein